LQKHFFSKPEAEENLLIMVRLTVSTPDSPPLASSGTSNNNHTQTTAQVITQSANTSASGNASNSYVVHQTETIVAPSTSSPVHTAASISQMGSAQQQIATQTLTIQPHHMAPPPFHQSGNGIHDNGHHHNGALYIGAAYANEFYPGAEAPAFFIPPELCPAHTQLCTAVHPEYGKKSHAQ
jgi:hypothetical protein